MTVAFSGWIHRKTMVRSVLNGSFRKAHDPSFLNLIASEMSLTHPGQPRCAIARGLRAIDSSIVCHLLLTISQQPQLTALRFQSVINDFDLLQVKDRLPANERDLIGHPGGVENIPEMPDTIVRHASPHSSNS
jgi:hypothetical protein